MESNRWTVELHLITKYLETIIKQMGLVSSTNVCAIHTSWHGFNDLYRIHNYRYDKNEKEGGLVTELF